MEFVFSVWYFIAIALVAGIVACLVVFIKMDKKDKALIDKFIKEAEVQGEVKEESAPETENKNNE